MFLVAHGAPSLQGLKKEKITEVSFNSWIRTLFLLSYSDDISWEAEALLAPVKNKRWMFTECFLHFVIESGCREMGSVHPRLAAPPTDR